jgi:hypothetical protein
VNEALLLEVSVFFGFGEIELRQTGAADENFPTGIINEFALDLSYSLKLSENSRWQWPEDLLTQILKLHRNNDATSARTFCN